MRSWLEGRETLASLTARESVLEEAKKRLALAEDLLVTGRLRSVDTARAALRIAQRYHAVVDPWDSDAAFEGLTAFQRAGGTMLSLSEARDLSELVIVVGGDSLVEDYPRLPWALSRGASTPLLLLGAWSREGCKPWLDAGFEVLAIDTPIESLPRSLAEAMQCESIVGWESQASRWLHQAGYLSVLWSMKHLNIPYGDLWYESMMAWIAHRNETQRAGAVCWSDLESGFHEVCTWWTGFPGRVRFDSDPVRYDPIRFTAQRWLEDRSAEPSVHAASAKASPPLILWIDDSFEEVPNAVLQSACPCIAISSRSPGSQPSALWLPSQPDGWGREGDFFRGDHAILVRGQDPVGVDHDLPSAAQWLKGLVEP